MKVSLSMQGFLPLFRQFIGRSLLREKARSLLAVFGIALGVAVMTAVRLANISIVDSFRAATDAVSGQADLRISATNGFFDETLIAKLTWLEQFGQVSPVVENYAMVVSNETTEKHVSRHLDRGELLYVLGVDVLRDSPLRKYRLLELESAGKQPPSRKLLDLLIADDGVVLTERFAMRTGLKTGQSIRLAFGSEVKTLRIRGLLKNDGPARTMQGNFALMDIAAAQWSSNRLGRLDYLDLELSPGRSLPESAAAIRDRLPEGLLVEPPSTQMSRTETMISAFQFNLAALSSVALLVGLFLIYNTISVSVAARRDEVGMLMALGATRRRIVSLFLCEALLLALVGVALGLPLGRWLAGSVVQATAQTVETFYIAAVAETTAQTVSMKPLEVFLTAAIALSLSLVAAAIPAFGAARIDPISVIRRIDSVARRRASRYAIVFAAICTILAWLCTRLPPLYGQPVFGFLAELLFMMAVACCVPLILTVFCRIARWLAADMGPVEGRLAVANLWAAVPQTSISVAALAMSLSMMIAIGVMVGSFRETVVYWLDSVLHADLVVKPVMNSSSLSSATISPAAASALRSDSAVDTACWYTSRQIPYRDSFVRLDTSDLDALLKHSRIVFKRPRDGQEQVLRSLAAQQPFAIVSESFSLLYKKQPGDDFELPTPKGPVRLPIIGVYYDYSSNLGTILLDYRAYHAYFGDDQPARSPMGMSLFLKRGINAEQTRQRLIREFADSGQSLYIVTNQHVHDEALRIFDSTFTITYALQTIAIIIAGAGIVSTLIRLIYERRREIGLLGLLGATAAQIRRMVVVEAALLGIVSHLTGTALGILLSLVLIFVINVQSFGWTIQFHLPIGFLLQSFIAVVAASILFGSYPANRAASTDALSTVRTT